MVRLTEQAFWCAVTAIQSDVYPSIEIRIMYVFVCVCVFSNMFIYVVKSENIKKRRALNAFSLPLCACTFLKRVQFIFFKKVLFMKQLIH